MQFVDKENLGASRYECAVTGRSDDPEGFFDARRTLSFMGTDNRPTPTEVRACVSAAAAKEMARMMGWRSPGDVAKLESGLEAMTAEIEALKELLAKVEQFQSLGAELEAVTA